MTSTPLPSHFGIGSLTNYAGLDQVGEGTYGFVYKAKDQKTGETVALKRLLFHKKAAGFPLNAVREIKFLKCLQHKNIVQLRDVVTSRGCEHAERMVKTDTNRSDNGNKTEIEKNNGQESGDILTMCGNLYLVFEFVEHDLGGLLDSKYRFNIREVKCIAKQLFEVLEYLAEKKVLHRDIKSSNILITNKHQVKLADFGLARSIQSADGRELRVDLTNNVVTMWYKAPELLLGAVRYAHAIDVWSTGCVIAELELGRPLFPGRTETEQIDTICRTLGTPDETIWTGITKLPNYDILQNNANSNSNNTLRTTLSNKLSDSVIDLLERVLVFDPTRRPSAKILLSNKYFLTHPLPPIDPTDLEPMQISAGVSYHEFRSKQQKRQRDDTSGGVGSGGVGGIGSAGGSGVGGSDGMNKRDSSTSLPVFSVGSSNSSGNLVSIGTSAVGVSSSGGNSGAGVTGVSSNCGIASVGMHTFTAPPPPLPTQVYTLPVPPVFTQPHAQHTTLPNTLHTTSNTTLPNTLNTIPIPPPTHPRAPNGSVGGGAIKPWAAQPVAPINPTYSAGVNNYPPYNSSVGGSVYNSNSTNTTGTSNSTGTSVVNNNNDVYGASVTHTAPVAPAYGNYGGFDANKSYKTDHSTYKTDSTYNAHSTTVHSGFQGSAGGVQSMNTYNSNAGTYNSGSYSSGGRGYSGRGEGRGGGRGEYGNTTYNNTSSVFSGTNVSSGNYGGSVGGANTTNTSNAPYNKPYNTNNTNTYANSGYGGNVGSGVVGSSSTGGVGGISGVGSSSAGGVGSSGGSSGDSGYGAAIVPVSSYGAAITGTSVGSGAYSAGTSGGAYGTSGGGSSVGSGGNMYGSGYSGSVGGTSGVHGQGGYSGGPRSAAYGGRGSGRGDGVFGSGRGSGDVSNMYGSGGGGGGGRYSDSGGRGNMGNVNQHYPTNTYTDTYTNPHTNTQNTITHTNIHNMAPRGPRGPPGRGFNPHNTNTYHSDTHNTHNSTHTNNVNSSVNNANNRDQYEQYRS